jgi:hypothetical protein
MSTPNLKLGAWCPLDGSRGAEPFGLPAHHLVTHGVVVGMTGSGKTGLVTVLVEEALRAGVPVLAIDVKGDLPNLLLAFPSFDSREILPWVEAYAPPTDQRPAAEIAAELAEERRKGLSAWSIGETELRDYAARASVRVITPGASGGEQLHVPEFAAPAAARRPMAAWRSATASTTTAQTASTTAWCAPLPVAASHTEATATCSATPQPIGQLLRRHARRRACTS